MVRRQRQVCDTQKVPIMWEESQQSLAGRAPRPCGQRGQVQVEEGSPELSSRASCRQPAALHRGRDQRRGGEEGILPDRGSQGNVRLGTGRQQSSYAMGVRLLTVGERDIAQRKETSIIQGGQLGFKQ